jgi:hypothetical protein
MDVSGIRISTTHPCGPIEPAESQKKSGEKSSLPVASFVIPSSWIPRGFTKNSTADRRSFFAFRIRPTKSWSEKTLSRST